MWTCIICFVIMAVNNGLLYIISKDYMACMLQYNARALVYRLNEFCFILVKESKFILTGFPGVRDLFAEKSTPGGTLLYINFYII